MREITGDFFAHMKDYDGLCFTSNNIVKPNGELVMGAGIAKQFRDRWPDLPGKFGKKVKIFNRPFAILHELSNGDIKWIINFPTKHHYSEDSNIHLIMSSAHNLVRLMDKESINKVLLTRPGCGRGNLSWENQVKPVISEIFKDDRVTIIS